MKTLLSSSILALFIIFSFNSSAQNLTPEQKASIEKFKQLVNNQDWVTLSETTIYPLKRTYPISPIENAAGFIERQSELFDDSFRSTITNSSVDNDWSLVGARGIMLKNGEVWLDSDGKLSAINHQTETEKVLEAELIQADKDSLPESLKVFERPILQMKTEKFFVRIDELKDGSFRFAGWLPASTSSYAEPRELIQNGLLEFDGSGGNHSYSFTSEFGTFVCRINQLGTETTPAGELVIYREEKVFRSYPAVWLKN